VRVHARLRKMDGDRCFYCGRHMNFAAKGRPNSATAEHLIEQSDGADWPLTNLVLACLHCNNGRAGWSLKLKMRSRAKDAPPIPERVAQTLADPDQARVVMARTKTKVSPQDILDLHFAGHGEAEIARRLKTRIGSVRLVLRGAGIARPAHATRASARGDDLADPRRADKLLKRF
jgi:HNH endonuclease